jgi:hypothetical protein
MSTDPQDRVATVRFLRQARVGHVAIPLGAGGFASHMWGTVPTSVVLAWLAFVVVNMGCGIAVLTYDLRRIDTTTARARTARLAVVCGAFALIWGALTRS